MESLDYWRMCDDLNVIQCILLILGKDPKGLQHIVERDLTKRPDGYEAVSTAVKNAILHKRLPANICTTAWEQGWASHPRAEIQSAHDTRGKLIFYIVEPNWDRTTVSVDALRIWLSSRNIATGFFFAPQNAVPAFLDPKQERYAPKLAAALEAWQAVMAEPALTRGKSVKTALTTWLNKNAARFGLVKGDGTPNNLAIEEAAKVANWDTKGGSPKTPTNPPTPSNTSDYAGSSSPA